MEVRVICLSIKCACGAVTADAVGISPDTVNRNVCHCHGCRMYAHVLGRAEEILDERGGTEVFQMAPAQLRFKTGKDQIACMQITPKGAFRWYTSCCNTPIAHTLQSPMVPFMAINNICVDWLAAGVSQAAAIGPIRARVNGRFTRSKISELRATAGSLLGMTWHYGWIVFGWWRRGELKPNPFFHPKSNKPIVEPSYVEALTLDSCHNAPLG